MSELRVAIFTGNYNHIRDGVSLTLNRLVAFLEENDIPVLVFGPTVDEPAFEHNGEFVPVPSVPMPKRKEYRITVGFPDKAQKRLREFNPTLVHLATPDLLGFRAMRWAQDKKVQIVASYHTHFTGYLKYYNLEILEVMGWKYLDWFYSQCHHIYVPSPSIADELKQKNITRGIRLWTRGVDTEQFNPDKRDEEWRKSIGLKEEDIAVTFVSRLVWEKNLQTFVDAVKKLKGNIKPIIVGDGPAMKELQDMLSQAHFTGFITGDKLARAYASSDIFFFPSETETFGNVTLEAMSSGLPSVVADAPGSKSLIESGINGYLSPPRDTVQFADCVQKIADDEKLRKKMGLAARQKAMAYAWKKVNGKLLENYKDALKERPPSLKF